MRTFAALLLLACCLAGLVACDREESGVKEEKTIKTPEGQTTVTGETRVEKEGDHARPDCGDPRCPVGCPCAPNCPCQGEVPPTDSPPPVDPAPGPAPVDPPGAASALDMRGIV